jgi:hypothetical protein
MLATRSLTSAQALGLLPGKLDGVLGCHPAGVNLGSEASAPGGQGDARGPESAAGLEPSEQARRDPLLEQVDRLR